MKKKNKIAGYAIVALLTAFFICVPVYAEEITAKLNNLNSLILNIISGVGAIVLGWGVFELAMAYQQHDSSQQTVGLKKIVSGLMMVFVAQIVNLLK